MRITPLVALLLSVLAVTPARAVLHITREVIHHGAEIALLRDLFAHTHRSTTDEREG